MRRIAAALLFVFSLVCCLTRPMLAQEGSATLTGFIQDSSKAVIPGVKVTAIDTNTNQHFDATSGKDGSYTIVSLPVGPYQMQIEKPGFKTILKDDLFLHTQDALEINFQMAVGSTSETVTVNGSSTNDSPAVSMTVTREFIEDMPLNGRSFQDLLALAPGAVAVTSSGYYSIDGQRDDANNFTVDGVSANVSANPHTSNPANELSGSLPSQTASGTTQALTSVDALQEFRIQTSGYTAEYGRQPGGQVQFTTRSGTNDFHGTAFDYFRNTVLDANDWFSNHAGDPRGAEHQNDFGGTFGGPVVFPRLYNGKDKTFFFFNYEGLRLLTPATVNETAVPTVAFRESAAPSAQPFLDIYSIPNGPVNPDGISAQFFSTYSEPNTLDSWSIRADQAVGDHIHTFARFSYTPSFTWIRETPANIKQNVVINTKTFTAGSTWSINANGTDELRFNYSEGDGNLVNTQDSFGGATPLPLTLLFLPQYLGSPYTGTTSLDIPNTSLNGGGYYQSLPVTQDQYNLVDSYSWSRGKHTFKTGVDYRHLSPSAASSGHGAYISLASVASVQQGTADLAIIEDTPDAHVSFLNLSLYAQDHWKLSSRFSLDYGLRWDLNPPPSFSSGQPAPTLATPFNNLNSAQFAPLGTPLYGTDFHDFAPRLGFAWQLTPSVTHPLVLRAGAGIFYDTGQAESAGAAFAHAGFVYTILSDVSLPLTSAQKTDPPGVTPSAPYINPSLVDPNLSVPYTQQWNLSLDVGLTSKNTLTTSYVGNEGKKLLFTGEYFSLSSPNITCCASIVTNAASSGYNALQVQDHGYIIPGLQLILSYSWAHAIDNLSNDYPTQTLPLRGNSDFDIRQTLNAALNYRVSRVASNRLLHSISDGWIFANRLTRVTGYPLQIIQGYFNPSTILGSEGIQEVIAPNLVKGVPVYLHGVAGAPGGWRLNPAAFSSVTLNANGDPIVNGDLSRNSLYGPALVTLNTALQRTFPIRDQLSCEFRVEAFNIFNHPNFGGIDSTLTDATFGEATSEQSLGSYTGNAVAIYQTGLPRSLQLSLKLRF